MAISEILGFPSVSVPVLSKTTDRILETPSSVGASLIRMLCFAPRPVPTATAVGVARPRASGQAITIAEIAKVRAMRTGCRATANQTRNVTRPAPIASTTRYWATVCQSLAGRFGILSGLDQLYYLREGCLVAYFCCLEPDRPRLVDGSTYDTIPFLFRNWNGFTCYQRFVNRRLTINYSPVNRHSVSRFQNNDVANPDL